MVKTAKPTIDPAKVLEELAQFTGSERYYRSTFGALRLTEGIHHLRERLSCYWLIDVVESYQPTFRGVPFQLWSIAVGKDRSAIVQMREDTGLDAIVTQKIGYTDFALSSFEFYCVDGVVLLKSEY